MAEQRTAFVFPGQASQYPGMGREFYDHDPLARAVFDAADACLEAPLSRLCFDGPEAELTMTENTQPAILTVSIAAYRLLVARGIRPMAVAGHSLGEYSALVAAEALDFGDAVRIVRKRGRYMQDAVAVGAGAMAAILGLDPQDVAALCREAARGDVVSPANFNSPEQTVVAGDADAVRRVVALAEARGARRAVMLPVSAPFHSPLMAPAEQRLAADLVDLAIASPTVPVFCNVDALAVTTPAAVRDGLLRQVTRPVRWTESIQRLVELGVNTFVEVGPGRVLSGLIRRIDRTAQLLNVEDLKSLEIAVAKLGGAN